MNIISSPAQEESEEEEVFPQVQLEPHVFTPVNLEVQETRFLILRPDNGDKDSMLDCSFSIEPLSSCIPYTYVVNTRGNPFATSVIPIDGYGKHISYNIGVFLRHIRTSSTPLRLWFRDLCVDHLNPAERAAYWNPAWMDTMIHHASNVIDLSEIMAELWDKGYLPRPFEPRPKDYINMREGEGLATRHHPMPLGSLRGPDETPLPHQYLPLDYCADEIRLINLWKGESHDAPLRSVLAYTPMHSEAAYNCVSYAWGLDDASHEMLLTGQTFLIRPNLDAFLRAVRSDENKYTFWIDAICIDQSNIAEKNRQIPRMLEIYEAADVVLSWAGELDDVAVVALELIRTPEFKRPILRYRDDGEWDVDHPETLPVRLAALYRFFQRPYFRRIWVIQELAAASQPTLMVGKELIDWSTVDFAAYHLNDILHRDGTMAARMLAADPELKCIEDRELAYVRKLFYFRHLRVRGRDQLYAPYKTGWGQIRDLSPGMVDACVWARDFESTSPHDKVFALWNLAQDVEGLLSANDEGKSHVFKLDYEVPLKEMYTQFATAVAMHTGSLDIICAAERQRSTGLGLDDMPSWVPDWSQRSKVSSMVRREHIPNRFMKILDDIGGSVYHACSFDDLTPSLSSSSSEFPASTRRFDFVNTKTDAGGHTAQIQLHVAGLLLDTIAILGPPAISQLGSASGGNLLEWLSLITNHCDHEPDTMPESQKAVHTQFWSMVAGEVTGVWGIEEIGGVEGREGFRTVCLVPEDEVEGKRDENGVRGKRRKRQGMMNTSVDIHRVITRGRRVCVTEGGSMALVPWDAEVGMRLAVVNGCSAPIVLEACDKGGEELGGDLDRDGEEGEEGETWRFVGSAFVQGWMEGEMLKEYWESDDEAWEAIDALGRLVIV